MTHSNSDISQVCSKPLLVFREQGGKAGAGRLREANTDAKGTWVWYCPESVNGRR